MLCLYFQDTRFIVQADHDFLKWILKLAGTTNCIAVWVLHHSKINLAVVYSAGIKHHCGDAPSRLHKRFQHIEAIEDDFRVAAIDTNILDCCNLRLENDHPALVLIVENNDSVREGATSTIADFLHHQAADLYNKQASFIVGKPNAEYAIDKNDLVLRFAPVHGAVPILIPQALQYRLLCHSHNPVIARQTNQQHMYDSMRREFYWPHMINIVYTTVRNCNAYAQNGTLPKEKRELQTFSAGGSLRFFYRHTWAITSDGKQKPVRSCHDWQAFKNHASNSNRDDSVIACRKRLHWFLSSTQRYPSARPDRKWSAVYDHVIRRTMHHTWR